MTTFFIVPGFKEQVADKNYRWLVTFLKKRGFKIVAVPVLWDRRVMSDYARDFKIFYRKHKSVKNYILGFSYGAVITFMTAQELKPDKIFLCSLSPDFAEDSKTWKPWIRKLVGKRRFKDTKTRSARKIARSLTIPTVSFYGELEAKRHPGLKRRAEDTARLAQRAKLVVVKRAPHRIDFPAYSEAIKRVLIVSS